MAAHTMLMQLAKFAQSASSHMPQQQVEPDAAQLAMQQLQEAQLQAQPVSSSAEELAQAAMMLQATPDMNNQMGTYSTGEHYFMTAAGPMRASDHDFRTAASAGKAPRVVQDRLEKYEQTHGRVRDAPMKSTGGGFGMNSSGGGFAMQQQQQGGFAMQQPPPQQQQQQQQRAMKSSGGGFAMASSGGGLAKAQKKRQEYIAENPLEQEWMCALHGEVRPLKFLIMAPDNSGQMICSPAAPCLEEPAFKKRKMVDDGMDEPIGYFPNGEPAREGDWFCPGCKDLQYSTNTSCRKCGTPQPTGEEITSVQVCGLPGRFDERKVREVFGRYVTLKTCNIQKDDVDSTSAILGMRNPEAAKWLIENLNNAIPMGMKVPVKIAFVPTFIPVGTTLQLSTERPNPGVGNASQAAPQLVCCIHGKARHIANLVALNDGSGRLRCIESSECRGLDAPTGRKQCVFFESGKCSKGDMCLFAHGENDNREMKKLRKCAFFEKGECKNGDRCAFAHGDDELQVPVCAISGKQVPQFGDWYCPSCGELRFKKNTTCRKCNYTIPETAAATTMPQGLIPGTGGIPGGPLDFGFPVPGVGGGGRGQGALPGGGGGRGQGALPSGGGGMQSDFMVGMQRAQQQTRLQQLEFEKQQMQQAQQEQEQRMKEMEQKFLAMQQLASTMGQDQGMSGWNNALRQNFEPQQKTGQKMNQNGDDYSSMGPAERLMAQLAGSSSSSAPEPFATGQQEWQEWPAPEPLQEWPDPTPILNTPMMPGPQGANPPKPKSAPEPQVPPKVAMALEEAAAKARRLKEKALEEAQAKANSIKQQAFEQAQAKANAQSAIKQMALEQAAAKAGAAKPASSDSWYPAPVAQDSNSLERPREYEVNLEGQGCDHGMTLDTAKDLKVKSINGAMAEAWNFAHPDNPIEVGDVILQVNGKRGSASDLVLALFGSLESNRMHKLKLRRRK